MLSEGCRRRRDAGASPRRSHKSGPTVFPGGSNAYRVFRVSRSRMGRGESGGSERRGEERRGRRKKKGRGKKMEGGRERRKKVVGAAKVREHRLVHAYALDCTEGKNLHGTVSCRSQGNTSVKLNFEQNSRVFRREVFRMYRELTQFSITRTSNPFRYYFSRFERLES